MKRRRFSQLSSSPSIPNEYNVSKTYYWNPTTTALQCENPPMYKHGAGLMKLLLWFQYIISFEQLSRQLCLK
jgi:hypothetical protein